MTLQVVSLGLGLGWRILGLASMDDRSGHKYAIRRPVWRTFFIPLLIVCLFLGSGSGLLIYNSMSKQVEEQLLREATVLASVINRSVEASIEPNVLQREVEAIGQERGVKLIVVVAGTPTLVVASTHSAWLGLSLDDLDPLIARQLEYGLAAATSNQVLSDSEETLVFASPFSFGSDSGGVLIYLDTRDRQQLLAQFRYELVFWILLMLLSLGLGIYWFVNRQILRPIAQLSHTLLLRAEGQRAIRADQAGDGTEIGELSASLNQMLDSENAHARELAVSHQALRESEDRYRRIIDTAEEGIAIVNLSGVIELVNPKLASLLGLSVEQLEGQVLAHYFVSTNWAEMAPFDGQEINSDLQLRNIDGCVRWVMASVSLFKVGNGLYDGALVMLTDITARKLAEEQVRQLNDILEERVKQRTSELELSNKELESFSYSVSHDLRAPLRGIVGWSEVLLQDHACKLDADVQKIVKQIFSDAQHMNELVDDLLILATVTRTHIKAQRIDLERLINELIPLLSATDSTREVAWRISSPLIAEGDLQLLRIVMQNLLQNAWKYTARRAVAEIEVGFDEQNQAYFVLDNGVGFDAKYKHQLFDPFKRFHRASEFSGTGIGLATVKRVIERHGGNVWAEPVVSGGAVFYFTLGPALRLAQ